MKFKIDWTHPMGRATRTETHIVLHPADYVSQVYKQKGLDAACQMAVELVSKKHQQALEDSKGAKR
jgi:hypothetical protein